MQISTQTIENVNKKEPLEEQEYISSKTNDFFSAKINLLEILEDLIHPKKELSFDEALNEKFLSLDFGSEFDIDADKIGVNDAIFFVNLLNNQGIINYSVEDDKINLSNDTGKMNVTNSLLNMIKTSYDTKKPIRLDFDEDMTVILKLDSKGKIQTHFIPGSLEVENYLKSNIPSLKQRFDEEQINYSSLSYSKYKGQNDNQKRNKKRSN